MLKRSDLTEEETHDWAERAAIREYDGGMTREEAEKAALRDIEERRKRKEGR